MPTYQYPWLPEQLKGNYLTLKNSQTGQRRKQYVSSSDLPKVKKELERFRALREGLPYPWQPYKLEGNYLYYTHAESGKETKVFIPTNMLPIIEQRFRRGELSQKRKLKAGKIEYIERGDYRALREAMSMSERAVSPLRKFPYTKRIGVVERVINGNVIVVDGVVIKVRGTEMISPVQDLAKWTAAKKFTESILVGKQVTLKIYLDNPTDFSGNTLAEVWIAPEDVPPEIAFDYRFSAFEIKTRYRQEHPRKEISFGQMLKEAAFSPTYEQKEEQWIIERIKKKKERQSQIEKLMQAQTALPPEQRDRPQTWGVADYILAPFQFLAWNIGAAMRNVHVKQQTGQWGGYTWKDRLYVSDTNTLVRQTKNLLNRFGFSQYPGRTQRFEPKGSKYVWREYSGENAPKNEWEGGFWDKITTDVSTDPLTWLFWFETAFLSTPLKLSGGSGARLTPQGKQIYAELIQKYGTAEARHRFSYLIRTNKAVRSTAIWKEGIRLPGLNYELIPAKYSTEPLIAGTAWIASKVIRSGTQLNAGISTILKGVGLAGGKRIPIEYREYGNMNRYLNWIIDQEYRHMNDEIWKLQQEANRIMGRGSGRVVTELFDDPTKREMYPQLKPLIEKVAVHSKNIENAEMVRGLLEKSRANYLHRTLTPEARTAFAQGKPPKMPEGIAEQFLEQRTILGDPLYGGELNPYNRQRMYEQTVSQINDWSMKNNGYKLFEEDAFKALRTRAKLHVTSVQVHDYLAGLKSTLGKPLDKEHPLLPGYATTRIQQFQGVQLPEGMVYVLEKDPLIRASAPELEKKTLAQRVGGVPLKAYDTTMSLWKLGLTHPLVRPAFVPMNLVGGAAHNFLFARLNPKSYGMAWKYRWNLWRGKANPDDLFFTSELNRKYTYKEIQELLSDRKRNDLIMSTTGQVEEFGKKGFWRTIYGINTEVERTNRLPLWLDRLKAGDTPEQADDWVRYIQFDYSRESMSVFEREVLHRTMGFYVWYTRYPLLVTHQLITNPLPWVLTPKIVNVWNGERGDVERNYLTDIQKSKFLLKIPGTQGYYVDIVPLTAIGSYFSLTQTFSQTQFNFYWEEAQKDPDIIRQFAKDQMPEIDWLQRGGGVAKIEGNSIVITYKETGETISASLVEGKLRFINDDTGIVIKDFPIKNIEGRIAINTDNRPLERLAARWLAPLLLAGIESYWGHDLAFGTPIEETGELAHIVNTMIDPQKQAYKELSDPTREEWVKLQEHVFGNMIYEVKNSRYIPLPEEAVKEAVDKMIITLKGDYLGCGWD